jgi:hypothetical protein
MTEQLHAYEFPDTAFVVGGNPRVCVAPVRSLRPYMTVKEIDWAFSGYASYRQLPWMTRYVGVWGRKNCQRFRRFLRERGAELVLHRERPPRLRLMSYVTHQERWKVRSLSQLKLP